MQTCERCVLPETYPGIKFDDRGICNFCMDYENYEPVRRENEVIDQDELKKYLRSFRDTGVKYDALVPVSGGVDSCYTLIQLVENYELKPLVFHSDQGWDKPAARHNVEKLCKMLDVDLLIWKNDLRFMQKLFKYFNEVNEVELSPCFVCGNMLYLNGLELADYFRIHLVINGYSKGQAAMMHDTLKARNLLAKMVQVVLETGDRDFFDKFSNKWKILEKQVIFEHRRDFAGIKENGKILFIPFFYFKFNKTDKERLLKICQARFDYEIVSNSYPYRTTNCEMIWLNSFMDMKKRNYTHYHDEYSVLIRAGEISREQALHDLALNPPAGLLEKLADEIELESPYFK